MFQKKSSAISLEFSRLAFFSGMFFALQAHAIPGSTAIDRGSEIPPSTTEEGLKPPPPVPSTPSPSPDRVLPGRPPMLQGGSEPTDLHGQAGGASGNGMESLTARTQNQESRSMFTQRAEKKLRDWDKKIQQVERRGNARATQDLQRLHADAMNDLRELKDAPVDPDGRAWKDARSRLEAHFDRMQERFSAAAAE